MSQLLDSFLLHRTAFCIIHGSRCKRRMKENGVRATSEESQARTTPLPSHSSSLRRVCIVQGCKHVCNGG